jgi:hypothetical protein
MFAGDVALTAYVYYTRLTHRTHADARERMSKSHDRMALKLRVQGPLLPTRPRTSA